MERLYFNFYFPMNHNEHMRNGVEKTSAAPSPQEVSTKNLNTIIKSLKEGRSEEKLNLATDYVLKLAQIDAKYKESKQEIQKDVRFFIEASLGDRLYKHVGEYNVSKFDTDGRAGLDEAEENNYSQALAKAIEQIIGLGGLNKFSKIHHESDSKSGMDLYIADKLNVSQLGKIGDKNFIDEITQKGLQLSESQYKAMAEAKFDITSKESLKDLGILLAKDIGSGVESLLRFVLNIPSGIILFPRYGAHRAQLLTGNNEQKIEAQIKIDELVEQNPALGIVELLGEKGWEAIKNMGKMLTSGKTGDISQFIVNLAGLVAGGAGVVKLGAKFTRAKAVSSARALGREGRMSVEVPGLASREGRALLNKTQKGAEKTAKVAQKVDGVVSGGAALGVAGDSARGIGEKIKEKRVKPSREQVIANSSWLERGDVGLPDQILKENGAKALTSDQLEVVKKVHKEISKGIYNNSPEDIRKMTEALKAGGLDKKQIRILMEHGITGEFKFDAEFFARVHQIDNQIILNGDVEAYLKKLIKKEPPKQELSLEEMVIIIKGDPKEFKDPEKWKALLSDFPIPPPSNQLLEQAYKGFEILQIKEFLSNPQALTASQLVTLSSHLDEKGLDAILKKFVSEGDGKEVSTFIGNIIQEKSGFSLDVSKISDDTFKAIFDSPKITQELRVKLALDCVSKNLSVEQAKALNTFLSDLKENNVLSPSLADSYISTLDVIINPNDPKNIVKRYLNGGIEMESEIAKIGSPERRAWTTIFEQKFDERFNMVLRGKPSFFTDMNLGNFFHFTFHELDLPQKAQLYELVKEGGLYYEKIKGYRSYDEVLEQSQSAFKKMQREK